MAPPTRARAIFATTPAVPQNPCAGLERLLTLQPAVIDFVIESAPVPGASAIVRSDYRVALQHEVLDHGVFVIVPEIAMDALAREDDQRLLFGSVETLRDEGHRPKDQRVSRAWRGWILAPGRRRT